MCMFCTFTKNMDASYNEREALVENYLNRLFPKKKTTTKNKTIILIMIIK